MDLYPIPGEAGTAFWDLQVGMHLQCGVPMLRQAQIQACSFFLTVAP